MIVAALQQNRIVYAQKLECKRYRIVHAWNFKGFEVKGACE